MKYTIPFNIPYVAGNEIQYISEAINNRSIIGDGPFTKKCERYFEDQLGFAKCYLTTSCTDALEMAAILLNIKEGDEVIVPAFTFVSTANAFVLRGANIVFADSMKDCPNIDVSSIEKLITPKTRAIVVMHYAGIIADMEAMMSLAEKHNIYVVEDAALALGSYLKGKSAGTFAHLSAFSFHGTKNIVCGEGGLLVINDKQFVQRAEVIREKGTNRNAYYRGEVDKYGWVDIGSSFIPSDIVAAYLFAQLEKFELINNKRMAIWETYHRLLSELRERRKINMPMMNDQLKINGSIFYFTCQDISERSELIEHMKKYQIQTTFHYQALHKSKYYSPRKKRELPYAENFSDTLIRLPIYCDLKNEDVHKIAQTVIKFYK